MNERKRKTDRRETPLPSQPLSDEQLRRSLRQIAAQITGATQQFNHPRIAAMTEAKVTDQSSVEDVATVFLAALNRCYLEPAAMILWFLDQATDPNRPGSQRAERFLRALARRPVPRDPDQGDDLARDFSTGIAAATIERMLEEENKRARRPKTT